MSSDTTDIIFIGKKPLMTYVTTAIIQLATLPEVTLKARGQTMGFAIDIAQIILRKTGNTFTIGAIK
jgi:archaea-specific DNA-binding protein